MASKSRQTATASSDTTPVAQRRQLEEWHAATALPYKDLNLLTQKFKTFSRGGALSRDQFRKVIVAVMPSISNDFADRLFRAFDVNVDHKLNFHEIINGLQRLLKGNSDQKLKLLFDIYDGDGDGSLSAYELLVMANLQTDADGNEDLYEKILMVKHVMDVMDLNRDGQINWMEFKSAFKNQHMLLECFQNMADCDEIVLFPQIPRQRRFDWNKLNTLLRYGRTKHSWGDEVDRQQMRIRLQDCDTDNPKEVERLFKEFQQQPSSSVLKKLLTHLSLAITGGLEDKIRFYFEVYSTDSSDDLSGSEIFRLIAGDNGVDDDVAFCEALVEKITESTDGEITCKGILEAASTNPLFLEILPSFKRDH